MALEDLLEKLNNRLEAVEQAITKNTAATDNLTELRGKAIEAVQGAAESGKKPTATKKATEKPKETPKAEDKPEDKAEISESPENRVDPNSPLGKLRAAIAEFVNMDEDPDLAAERHAVIKKFFAHDKIKAETADDVPEALIPAVIKNIEKVTPKHKEKSEAKAGAGDDLDLDS